MVMVGVVCLDVDPVGVPDDVEPMTAHDSCVS